MSAFCAERGLTIRSVSLAVLGDRLKVGVRAAWLVGSWREVDEAEWNPTDGNNFPKACRDLGAAVARAGHVLIIGGQRDHTADYHAIEGIIGALGNSRPTPPPIQP